MPSGMLRTCVSPNPFIVQRRWHISASLTESLSHALHCFLCANACVMMHDISLPFLDPSLLSEHSKNVAVFRPSGFRIALLNTGVIVICR